MPAPSPAISDRWLGVPYADPGAVAVLVSVADAVADALRAADLAPSYAVERPYVPVHDSKDLAVLTLSVVPAGIESRPLTRSGVATFDYVIDVGVQQRLEPTNANFDPNTLVVQRVVDLFRGKELAGYEAARCVAADNRTIFVPHHVDEHQTFTSVVTLTFRMVR